MPPERRVTNEKDIQPTALVETKVPIWRSWWWARASPVSAPPEPLRKRGFAPDVVEQEMAWADPGGGHLPAG